MNKIIIIIIIIKNKNKKNEVMSRLHANSDRNIDYSSTYHNPQ